MISPSTRLLVRLFRWRLAACILVTFLAMLILTLADGPDGETPGLAAFVALTMVGLLRLHTRFYESFFPITDRQAAWIPIAATFAAWSAGLCGIFLAQTYLILFGRYTLDRFNVFWEPWLTGLPVATLVLLCALRLMRLNASIIYIGGSLIHVSLKSWIFVQFLTTHWLLCLAGAALLVWEAPAHWATLRRMNATRTPPYKILTFDLNGPIRVANISILVDILLGALLLGLIASPVARSLQVIQTLPMHRIVQENLIPILLMLAIIILPIPAGFMLLRQHRASGLTRPAALLVALLRLTVILNPLAHRLGVRRGTITRCTQCGGFKFAWQRRCPHCAEPGAGQPVETRKAWLNTRGLALDHAGMFYWVMIPAQILFVILFLNLHQWMGK